MNHQPGSSLFRPFVTGSLLACLMTLAGVTAAQTIGLTQSAPASTATAPARGAGFATRAHGARPHAGPVRREGRHGAARPAVGDPYFRRGTGNSPYFDRGTARRSPYFEQGTGIRAAPPTRAADRARHTTRPHGRPAAPALPAFGQGLARPAQSDRFMPAAPPPPPPHQVDPRQPWSGRDSSGVYFGPRSSHREPSHDRTRVVRTPAAAPADDADELFYTKTGDVLAAPERGQSRQRFRQDVRNCKMQASEQTRISWDLLDDATRGDDATGLASLIGVHRTCLETAGYTLY